jgi:hypothetical protein
VSGASKKSAKFLKVLNDTPGIRVRTGATRIKATASSPAEITAGSNFAAALAYGDVSIAAVGTTTFVCHGEAIAFGHPLLDAGKVQYTAHPASAVYVQPDPVFGPFKVANPGGPVGVVDQDRSTGIRAKLGAQPTSSFAITSSLRPDGGAAVTGSTTGIYQPFAPYIAGLHLQSNIVKALGAEGAGSAALKFTITGTRANGTPFTLIRNDHYSDTEDLASAPSGDLYSLLTSLVEQPFDNLKITGVNVQGAVYSDFRQYRVTAFKVKQSGKWVNPKSTIRVTAGKTITSRITLTKYRSSATVDVRITVTIPKTAKGAFGDLIFSDGPSVGLSGGGEGDPSAGPAEPTSLNQLLAALAAGPRNDSIVGSLQLNTTTKTISTTTMALVDAPVASYQKDIGIQVRP